MLNFKEYWDNLIDMEFFNIPKKEVSLSLDNLSFNFKDEEFKNKLIDMCSDFKDRFVPDRVSPHDLSNFSKLTDVKFNYTLINKLFKMFNINYETLDINEKKKYDNILFAFLCLTCYEFKKTGLNAMNNIYEHYKKKLKKIEFDRWLDAFVYRRIIDFLITISE